MLQSPRPTGEDGKRVRETPRRKGIRPGIEETREYAVNRAEDR
jgi:hypothetical protein